MDRGKTAVVLLAAGEGKRMESDTPKVLHHLRGESLIRLVVDSAKTVNPEKIVVVVGHGAKMVKEELKSEKSLSFVLQKEQLGTAHAVKQAGPELKSFCGSVFILCGDVPLTKPATLAKMLKAHIEGNASITLLSVDMDEPAGYGRIIRDSSGNVLQNIEDKDANNEQKKIKEINGGIYVFDSEFLFGLLGEVSRDNAQGEEYLPDLIGIAVSAGRKVLALKLDDPLEIHGVNRPEDLKKLENILKILEEKKGRACRV